MPGTPDSGARVASVCASFHTYVANTQRSTLTRQSSLVSTLRPSKENSFQNLVPIGNSHLDTLLPSMAAPCGNRIHRFFAAPSVHNGYCGEKGRLRGSIRVVPSPAYRPVCERRAGATGAVASVSKPAVALTIVASRSVAIVVMMVFIFHLGRTKVRPYFPSGGSIGCGTRFLIGFSVCR